MGALTTNYRTGVTDLLTTMQRLIPIFMTLLNMVVSRTEPIDMSEISTRSNKNHRNEMFLKSENMNVDTHDFSGLKSFTGRHRQIDNGNTDLHDLIEPEWTYEPDALNPRRIISLNDVNALDDLEEGSHSIDDVDEIELNQLTNYLITLLRQPTSQTPLVIVDEPTYSQKAEETNSDVPEELESHPIVWKRSRYWRYPYKRHNQTRTGFDYDAAYLCKPTRDDLLQLLHALHDVRQGNKSRTVNFCSRRRSAGMLFTNIRFIGRKK